MQNEKHLGPSIKNQVSLCDEKLSSPARLKAVADTRLMDTPKEVAFDRLAKMAAVVLRAPVTIISIIGERRQFFKANFGLTAPFDTLREVPIDDSICRYTLSGEEIIAADTSTHPLLQNHPTTVPWGIAAFLSIPMITNEGHVIGSFCAIDPAIHDWTETDLSLMRELTAAAMLEITLRQQLEDMTLERTMREQFVAALSHDLRNPIGVAKMSAELLADEESDPAERVLLTTMIKENMEHADAMLADLLNVTTIKAGEKMKIHCADCDMQQVAQTTISNLEKMHRRQILLKTSGDLHGFWDAQALRRIFDNLIVNGFKYGTPNTPVTLQIQGTEKEVLIKVHNLGNPIPAESLESIFEPFKRSEAAKKGSQKGWGIGLTLVRALVDVHGGKIFTTSSLVEGTTFTVQLPRRSSV